MKKRLIIIAFAALLALTPVLSGCAAPAIDRANAEAEVQKDWGVMLTAKDITPTGLTIVCEQSGGSPGGKLQTGSFFMLERLEDGDWSAVGFTDMKYELAWNEEAWCINADAEVEWPVDWSGIYGKLPEGSYRIGKEIMDFRGTGDFDLRFYYARFEVVTEAADTQCP